MQPISTLRYACRYSGVHRLGGVLTGFPVLQVLSVQPVHSLQQLPLLTAARVVDEVAGQDLLQLAHRQHLDGLLRVQVGQRGPDPSLGGRAHLGNGRWEEWGGKEVLWVCCDDGKDGSLGLLWWWVERFSLCFPALKFLRLCWSSLKDSRRWCVGSYLSKWTYNRGKVVGKHDLILLIESEATFHKLALTENVT